MDQTQAEVMKIEAETILRRHATRNFWLNVLDGTAFVFGVSMISRFTVLPLFVARLSSERWVQGLLPMIAQTGWALPPLFMAPLIASLPRRKPFIMVVTLGERLPMLALGLVLLFAPGLSPTTLLTIFFALFAIQMLSGGLIVTAWQDFVARLIPERRWGTFFGLQLGSGGVLGVIGAALAGTVLAAWPFPQNIGLLALFCFAAMVLSYIFMLCTVEPPQPAPPREPLRAFLGGVLPLLRRDRSFRGYLFCRAAIALGLVGHSFLTAAALERFNPSEAEIGVFTGTLLAAQAVCNLGLGALADRWGHKQVLELSTGLGMAALLLAFLAPSVGWYLPIFILVGAAQAGYQLSGFTLVLRFSTPENRPAYIGVANTMLAPVAMIGPLAAGLLAELTSYGALFVTLTLIGLAGLAALHWRVPIPHATAQASGD